MDSARTNDWLQILGMLGIIASLIFVGVQVRQTQRVGEGEELTNFAALSVAVRSLFIDNAEVWRKACLDEELSAEEKTKAAMLYKAYAEFSYTVGSAALVGISQADSQFLVNRYAANIHRYPGFAKLADAQTEWVRLGEDGLDVGAVQFLYEAINARLAVLQEIEPNPTFDVMWCGI